MSKSDNENIISSIFDTFFLYHNKQYFTKIANKTINSTILRKLSFKNIFQSTGKNKKTLSLNYRINSLKTLQNSNIVSLEGKKSFSLWDTNNNTCIQSNEFYHCLTSFIILQDGSILASVWSGLLLSLDTMNNFNCLKTIAISKQLGVMQYFDNLIVLPDMTIACSARLADYQRYIIILENNNTDYIKKKVINAHRDCITTIINVSSDKFASASIDGVLKVWSIGGDCLMDVKQKACDSGLQYIEKGNFLISVFDDITVKVWSMESYECVREILIEESVKWLLSLPNGFFASAGMGNLKIWDVTNFQCIKTLNDDQFVDCHLELMKDNRIVSASGTQLIY
jgi:hypothetical protein